MLRYALTIFVSAFLLFQVQPLIGRFILPWFGGGPSIWTSCMLFFQAALLGGYLYAHVLCAKLSLRSQAITHLVVLGVSVMLLPIAPDESWKPLGDQSPLARILWLLVATVGGPYFVLASTGPLMQKWFSQTSPDRSPYRLYALSNIGSLLALLSYPIAFEPWLTLHEQVVSWTSVYVVFACCAAWCTLRVLKYSSNEVVGTPDSEQAATNDSLTSDERPGVVRMMLWLSLSACGSAVLLATTNQLCIDVATVPFLWILPLSLYLLSFIICFDRPQWYDRRAFGALLMVCVPLACWGVGSGADLDLVKQVVIFSATLFACCMSCHGELVQARPAPRYLTLFYLVISAGGVLGGLFVAIVATNLFSGYWEFPISLVACCTCTLAAMCYQRVWSSPPSLVYWTWFGGAAGMLVAAIWLVWMPHHYSFEAVDEVAIFGGLGCWILLGLIAIGTQSEKKVNIWVWFGLSLPLLVWTIGWGIWRLPEVMTLRLSGMLAGSWLLAFTAGLGLLWGLTRLSKSRQSFAGYGLVVLLASLALMLTYQRRLVTWPQVQLLVGTGISGLVIAWLAIKFRQADRPLLSRLLGPLVGAWGWVPLGTLVGVMGYDLWQVTDSGSDEVVYRSRNFYGVLNVEYEGEDWDDEYSLPPKYELTHGQIQHGFQYDDEYWKSQPTTYYGRQSGVGVAIATVRERKSDGRSIRVGVVGLGTGTIAAYGEEHDDFQFYEINPAVRDLSGRFFTYLQDTAALTSVKIGDARIVMDRELTNGQSQKFDVLAVDAFSSDAIPVHLLTAECGDVYRQHLANDGILAIHISNRFLDLAPVVRGLANHLEWQAMRIDDDGEDEEGVFSSTWVLLTPSIEVAEELQSSPNFDAWKTDEPVLLWTDDYSGLWRILSF